MTAASADTRVSATKHAGVANDADGILEGYASLGALIASYRFGSRE